MKKGITLGSFLIIITLTLAPTSSDAFNPLAHIYIAENACPSCSPKIDFFYGSVAPDLAWSVADPDDNWKTVLFDTHYRDIRRFALGSTQEAFAAGWLTHSENYDQPGADYYAHIYYTNSLYAGYVIDTSMELLNQDPTGKLNLEFSHYVIEATIDFMLIDIDPSLPGKLLFANLFRSWEDRNLMMRVFVWRWWDKSTEWKTVATAEFAFRQLINRYAIAFMLSDPEEALAQLAVELAKEVYNLDIDADDLLNILEVAIDLCEEDANQNQTPDYLDVINDEVIPAVSDQLN
jgi:hypothetical protein